MQQGVSWGGSLGATGAGLGHVLDVISQSGIATSRSAPAASTGIVQQMALEDDQAIASAEKPPSPRYLGLPVEVWHQVLVLGP